MGECTGHQTASPKKVINTSLGHQALHICDLEAVEERGRVGVHARLPALLAAVRLAQSVHSSQSVHATESIELVQSVQRVSDADAVEERGRVL